MSVNASFSNASTPPRSTTRTAASSTSTSRVDGLYERQPQGSFVDSAYSEEESESMTPTYTPSVRHDEATVAQCWSCRQTQRLRTSLKKIELDYLSQIHTLQQQVKEATTQRALAVQERDALLTNSDEVAAQQLMIEQEAQSLRVEVMQVMQERHELRQRVQELERSQMAARQHQLAWFVEALTQAEATARGVRQDAEAREWGLLMQLQTAEKKAKEELRKACAVVTTPRRCNAASGTAANGSTILSSTFSPNSTSSPGPSDGGREHRTCSPRPSQRREQSQQHHTQRPSVSGDSARSGSEGTMVISRTLLLSHSVEEAEEKVRRVEWRLEQQRSDFEMQLADERALTADMQAEVDDLIENELVLLESESRLRLERDAAEALGAIAAVQLHHFTQQCLQQQQQQQAMAKAITTVAPPHADVLDLVEESESAAWRIEASETMSTIQQQLYQLLSAARSTGGGRQEDAWEELKECVRGEAAEVKEHLAALLDASAQSRVDGDALREEMAEQFGEVEERQCRQEAFLVAMTTRPTPSDTNAALLQELRQALEQQRCLSERLCEALQCTPAVVETAEKEEEEAARPKSRTAASQRRTAAEASACTMRVLPTRRMVRHRDPAMDVATPETTFPVRLGGGTDCSERRPSLSITSRPGEDQLSTITTVSDTTLDNASSSLLDKSDSSGMRLGTSTRGVLFEPRCVHVDVSAATEQISALLSDESSSDSDSAFPSPYEEY